LIPQKRVIQGLNERGDADWGIARRKHLIYFVTEDVMRLATFIRSNLEPILQKWEDFAQTLLSAHAMDKAGLRDHAKEILLTIASDLDQPQTRREQADKSMGHGSRGKETAAEIHGVLRLESGFDINEAISEYRALRASVIALWTETAQTLQQGHIEDLIRFNEAIDQALAESLASYTVEKEMQTRLFGTILSASPDQVSILDLDGRLMYVNTATVELYGMPSEEIIGKNYYDLGFPFAAELQQHIEQVVKTKEKYRGELSHAFSFGSGDRFEYILAPVMSENGQAEAIVGFTRDITERKAAEEKSWYHANYDLLTGLPNRRLFRDRLEQDIMHAERIGLQMALLFIDLDRFKEVNDLRGHDAGDILLRQVAERISSCVRTTDTVARLGGDEFTVALTEVTESGYIDGVAQSIIDELARPFQLGPNLAHISGSIGITVFPQDATTPEDLVRNADQAMYVAKNAGRNQMSFFTSTIREETLARMRFITDLRQALPEGQLAVYYQPIIDLSNGQIIKAEALLRWHHPQRGLMLPEVFVGLAEETGLISEIGNWVFTEAAKHAQEWGSVIGRTFQISINTSPAQFRLHENGLSWVEHLQALGLTGDSISMEIAEDLLLNASPVTAERLSNLRKAGIKLTIAHFGIGYSSMAYLKKFDVDYLKIDQSLVQHIAEDMNSRTIAETVIVMAHKLGLKVVGEGVETVAQQDWLKAAGCDYVQGYLFSKALSSDDFVKLLV
jgi:diguanylate cyclase (GGDEF)-like protein/PAS domain S-box-containing protein